MTDKLKILWFVNIPTQDINQRYGIEALGSGGWLSTLAEMLRQECREDYALGICCVSPSLKDEAFMTNGIQYFTIRQRRHLPETFETDWAIRRQIGQALSVVDAWKPDIVHVHGSERFYIAMLPELKARHIATVVSWQGIMGACARWENYFGTTSLATLLAGNRLLDLLCGRSLLNGYWLSRRQARRELKYGRLVEHYLGRTDLDRAWTKYLNSQADYTHVGEILRDCFYTAPAWSLAQCHRHHLVVTAASHPRKGLMCLLQAAVILRAEYPELQLNFIGNLSAKNVYGKYFLKMLKRSGVAYCLHGLCTGAEVMRHLREAHVFVLPSFIENSPNSLGEAQILGMPVVASDVGGMSSMIESGHTGLMFPREDVVMLAERIRQIFQSDELAEALGSAARAAAMNRHDKNQILKDLISAYRLAHKMRRE